MKSMFSRLAAVALAASTLTALPAAAQDTKIKFQLDW